MVRSSRLNGDAASALGAVREALETPPDEAEIGAAPGARPVHVIVEIDGAWVLAEPGDPGVRATLRPALVERVNEILGEVQKLGEKLNSIADGFSGFGETGMGDLFTNLNGLVDDNRERFDTVMTNLEELTTKLNRGEGTLGKLINEDGMYTELMSVVGDFRSISEELGDALGPAREIMDKVQAGEGTLGRLLVDDTIARELEATVANMKSFSDKLNSGEGTLGKLVSDDSLYVELRSMLNKADQALDSVGDSGPITAVGAVSGALF